MYTRSYGVDCILCVPPMIFYIRCKQTFSTSLKQNYVYFQLNKFLQYQEKHFDVWLWTAFSVRLCEALEGYLNCVFCNWNCFHSILFNSCTVTANRQKMCTSNFGDVICEICKFPFKCVIRRRKSKMDRQYKDQPKEKWTDNTKTSQRKNGQIIVDNTLKTEN